MTLMEAVQCDCPGTIRKIMAQNYNNKIPTITQQYIDNVKLVCKYQKKEYLLDFFTVPIFLQNKQHI